MGEKIVAEECNLTCSEYKDFVFAQLESNSSQFAHDNIENYKMVIEKLSNNQILAEPATKAAMLRVLKLFMNEVESIGITDQMKIIIFQNSDVEISYDTRINGKYSMITFYIKNKSSNPINNLQVNFEDIPEIKVFSQKTNRSVQAGEEQKIEFALLMVKPLFSKIRVNFEGDNLSEYLTLPISIGDFSTIMKMDFDTFIKKWNLISNSKYNSQIDIPSPNHSAPNIAGLLNSASSGPGSVMKLENGTYFAALDVEVNNTSCGTLIRMFQERNGNIKFQVRSCDPEVAEMFTHAVNTYCNLDN
ncbi:hypothetical protein TVAG_180200 [Trichomonas vaginalis G3]|uniref:Clathrin adaptor alpha/beta/gamma-adaptin appendage Ig-like subdomain domain-containing protein n=1 Tax=Trichomonas vaginalis (strain ATCC PRA-98 / G3) TaxID=412133 RepID=A2EE49_TRIV3|nr:clathrin adaptor appendage domain family [Trichomonas vaginalis G3]EAY09046.1 hypothetical protein TVAG_180200 [Trichomonas vaginalis G3]KAI5503440.1 clathrin adaptor appendage domain family [Trichomonas vaginalis G3]|eukprot:XP_001321269.1 hypothetical protein [Trichomonas vaginalis G3]